MNRLFFERGCRTLALVCLALALWASVRTTGATTGVPTRYTLVLADSVVADTGTRAVSVLREAWFRQVLRNRADGPMDTLELPLRTLPSVSLRAAFGAMVAGGEPMVWGDATGAVGLALSAVRNATPQAPMDVRVSGHVGRALVLRDVGGILDSVPQPAIASAWQLRSASGRLVAQQGKSVAMVAVPDSLTRGRVLVLAQPGWEGKFVVAALEEAGWSVDGRLRVSPSGAVTIGAPQRLDVSRYAAVVLIDSMAVDATALAAFVRRGGGLVLGGDALRLPALSALRPARATELRGGIAGALLTTQPRRGLDAWELDVPAGSIVLQTDPSDHGHEEPALVARRVGKGRVVAMPYRESWRWRMQGTDDGVAEHRRWWMNALQAAVPGTFASAAATSTPMPSASDWLPGAAAPYADWVARVGAATADVTFDSARTGAVAADAGQPTSDVVTMLSAPLLLLSTLLALLAEWASRRLRGVR